MLKNLLFHYLEMISDGILQNKLLHLAGEEFFIAQRILIRLNKKNFAKYSGTLSLPLKSTNLRDVGKNNYPGRQRILVRIQGAMKRAYRDM